MDAGTALVVVQQTAVMFFYMAMGYLLFRAKIITAQGSKEIANLLIRLVIPIVIINSFCVEFSREALVDLGVSVLVGALALLIAIVTARLIFRKAPINDFAAAFSNAGFIGIPLVKRAFGAPAVFLLVGMIAMLNLLQWTYGVMVLTGKRGSLTVKSVFLNPIMVGSVLGLVLFCTGLGSRLPTVLSSTIEGVSALNAPLAMIVLGVYLAQTDPKKLFTTGKLYALCAVRLLLIPILTLGAFYLLRCCLGGSLSPVTLLSILLAASAPVGANVAVYAQLHDLDYPYACQTVALSTLLSMVTLPLILLAAFSLIPG